MPEYPASLAEAMAILQTRLPKVYKSKTANTGSYSYKYADLEDCEIELLPLMGELGLSFLGKPSHFGDKPSFKYTLLHISGEREDDEMLIPQPRTPQDAGSWITYCRRYCLCAVTGLVTDEDDDGQIAARAQAKQERAERAKATPAQSRTADPERARRAMMAEFTRTGFNAPDKHDEMLERVGKVIGRTVTSRNDLTADEVVKVTAALKRLPDAKPAADVDGWPDTAQPADSGDRDGA